MAQESAYQLLLYAQLLHLPDLAEWCKSFLRAAAAQGQDCHLPNLDGICRATAKIARPVPRKPSVVAPLAEEADEGKQSPAQIFQGTLERPPPTSLGSPFLKGQFSNWPTPPPPPPQLTTGLFIPPPPPLPSSTIPSLPLSSLYPVACRRPVVVISRDWDGEEEEEEEEEIVVGTEEDAHSTTLSTARKSASSSSTTAAELPPSSSNFEVAACDGPVRFHRVANPCTAKSALGSSSSSSSDEEDQDCPSSSSSGAPSDVTYQCLFCNHIFKSHYCYQKHKRRHLNPFVADFHQVRILLFFLSHSYTNL